MFVSFYVLIIYFSFGLIQKKPRLTDAVGQEKIKAIQMLRWIAG